MVGSTATLLLLGLLAQIDESDLGKGTPVEEERDDEQLDAPAPPPAAPTPDPNDDLEEVSGFAPGDAPQNVLPEELGEDAPYGLMIGASFALDFGSLGDRLGYAPEISAAYASRDFGVALALVVARPVGLRVDGRYYLRNRKVVRPYVSAGASFFFADFALHAGAGVDWKLGPVVLLAAASYERFLVAGPDFLPQAILLSVGAAWHAVAD